MAYPGIRIFIGACYAKDLDRHVLFPTGLRTPDLAIQMCRKAIEKLNGLLDSIYYLINIAMPNLIKVSKIYSL